jgi:hypothetical protein
MQVDRDYNGYNCKFGLRLAIVKAGTEHLDGGKGGH